MTFPTTPTLAFTAGVSTISAVTANAWRSYFPKALDAVGGGVYTNLAEIEFPAGSSGWKFGALVTMNTTSTVLFQAGGTVTINSDPTLTGTLRVGLGGAGGAIRLYPTSTTQWDSGATVTCNPTSWAWGATSAQTHASGSSDTYGTGSTLAINTALATLGQNSVLTINGASGHVATVAFGQYSVTTHAGGSTDTYANGANLTAQSNSTVAIDSGAFVTITIGGGGNAGSLTIGGNGTATFSSASVCTHASGSSEIYAAGSTKTDGSTTTRTGSTTRSGTGAWEGLRPTVASNADATITGSDNDIIYVSIFTSDKTWTINNMGAGQNATFKIKMTTPDASKLIINRSGGATIYTFDPGAGNTRTVEFYWDGAWQVGMVGAVH